MRGDRPVRHDPDKFLQAATPHARGSTWNGTCSCWLCKGYPACAGIDHAYIEAVREYGRLPRMRGDRPAAVKMKDDTIKATPHARGSTRSRELRNARHQGCPACAGIDLGLWVREGEGCGLPRMRGDRPGG